MAGDTKSSSTATGLSSATSNRALLPPDRASLRICLSPSSRWYRHANKGRTAVGATTTRRRRTGSSSRGRGRRGHACPDPLSPNSGSTATKPRLHPKRGGLRVAARGPCGGDRRVRHGGNRCVVAATGRGSERDRGREERERDWRREREE